MNNTYTTSTMLEIIRLGKKPFNFLRFRTFFCALALIFAYVRFLCVPVGAQNISGLEGKQLTKLDDIGSALTSLIGTGGLDGNIQSVTVTKDSENKLGFKVEFTGFETAYLRAKVMDTEKKAQNDIEEVEMDLNGVSSPLNLEMTMNPDVPEATNFDSPYLEIKLSKNKNSFGGKVFLYSLNKSWQKDIRPENLIVDVVPTPIGTAASLKENTSTLVIPQKKQQFKLVQSTAVSNKVLLNNRVATNNNISGIKTTTATNKVTTTATASGTKDGTWVNADANTKGITKIIISGNGTKMHVYGKCSPNDCDWGTKSITAMRDGRFQGYYDQNFANSTFYIKFANNKMSVQEIRKYKDNRPQKNNSYTFNKLEFKPVVMAQFYPLALNKEEVDKGAQGPSNVTLPLWEELKADVEFEEPTDITNIEMAIYEDKNPASGIYYYLPASYHLKWNEDDGYGLKMLYGTAEGTDAGNVRFASTLTASISNKEIEFMKELVKAYIANDSKKKYDKLRLVPLEESPSVSFPEALNSNYDIPEDKVSVIVASSITNPIDVSWVTDSKTKQEMQVALLDREVGIKGVMKLSPQSEELSARDIPVEINLSDSKTFGMIDLEPKTWRTNKWTNKIPYPIKLKKLHMLMITKQGNKTIPLVYSWNLGDVEVPPASGVNFDDSKVPSWLDNPDKAKRIWIEYAVVPCEECDNNVIEQVTGGTHGADIKNISFETFKVLETTGAAFLQIKVRSIQGDPRSKSMTELASMRIEADNNPKVTGPLYVPVDKEMDYEYTMTLVMPDGMVYKANDWIHSTEEEVFIGMHNLESSFSSLPSAEEEEDTSDTSPSMDTYEGDQ